MNSSWQRNLSRAEAPLLGWGFEEARVPSPAHLSALAAWRKRAQRASGWEETGMLKLQVEEKK